MKHPNPWAGVSRVHIRFPTLADLNACFELDGSVETTHVWQVRHTEEPARVAFALQRVPLPRPVRLPYPPLSDLLMRRYEERDGIWVALEGGRVQGFVLAEWDTDEQLAWLRHLVVDRRARRRGIGSALLTRAARAAADRGLTRMVVAVSVKNDPGIRFLRHHGFTCVGYNGILFASGEYALYFGRALQRWV